MRQTYRVLASLIALGVLVQAAAVAYGWFQVLGDVEDGSVYSESSSGNAGHVIHSINGSIVLPALGLVLLGVSFAAAKEVPRARKWAGIVAGLIFLQFLLAALAYSVPAIGALHGLNALFVLGAAGRAASLTRTSAGAASAPTAAGIPAQRSSGSSTTGADLPG